MGWTIQKIKIVYTGELSPLFKASLNGTLTKGNTIVMITFCYGITRRDLEGYE